METEIPNLTALLNAKNATLHEEQEKLQKLEKRLKLLQSNSLTSSSAFVTSRQTEIAKTRQNIANLTAEIAELPAKHAKLVTENLARQKAEQAALAEKERQAVLKQEEQAKRLKQEQEKAAKLKKAAEEKAKAAELANLERQKTELRLMITGTMSAGKSTLINAIIGEKLAKTAAETVTAQISYFDSKKISFKTLVKPAKSVVIIDTPGVNAALNPEHAEITHVALGKKGKKGKNFEDNEKAEIYDKLIYIFNADRLGTEDEMEHLEYIAENVPKDKLIFVLNKVDNFDSADDSIEESLAKLKKDLLANGFPKPKVFPISAHFALLLKLQKSDQLSRHEQRTLASYVDIFSEPDYDLSQFYGENQASNNLAYKCGIFWLERILFEP
ncbi:MAG: 50S ribosome-binding GTPase [Firmicutes bacterium]|nr:50S ribosome-binding GTPase [Bacillota bacterium]